MKVELLFPLIFVTFLLIFVDGEEPEAGDSVTCTRKGPICKDCKTKGVCEEDGDKSFRYNPDKEEKCSPDRVCDEIILDCVLEGTCRYKEEVCPKNGPSKEALFPNPYSCNVYVGCKNSETNYYLCKDEAYDAELGKCGGNIVGNQLCNDYPIVCETAGQKMSISKYNYVCTEENNPDGTKILYPMIVLDGTTPATTAPTTDGTTTTTTESITEGTTPTTTASTTEGTTTTTTESTTAGTTPTTTASTTSTAPTTTESTTSTTTTTSTSPTTPSTTPTTPTTTTTTTPKPFECTKEGYFKDPKDCYSLYWCLKNGNSFIKRHQTCRHGTYFDESSQACLLGKCKND